MLKTTRLLLSVLSVVALAAAANAVYSDRPYQDKKAGPLLCAQLRHAWDYCVRRQRQTGSKESCNEYRQRFFAAGCQL
jgi:hypothetical protein